MFKTVAVGGIKPYEILYRHIADDIVHLGLRYESSDLGTNSSARDGTYSQRGGYI